MMWLLLLVILEQYHLEPSWVFLGKRSLGGIYWGRMKTEIVLKTVLGGGEWEHLLQSLRMGRYMRAHRASTNADLDTPQVCGFASRRLHERQKGHSYCPDVHGAEKELYGPDFL